MLQGDALAVQLFIGAAAINALCVAMTQAGWTHRWFIRSMFSLTAMLAAASASWPYLESRIPLVNDGLRAIAASRAAWFFAGVIPAAVFGMLISDAIRRKREGVAKIEPTREWFPLGQAISKLGEQKLNDILANARENARAVQQRLIDFDTEYARRTKELFGRNDFDKAMELASLSGNRTELEKAIEPANRAEFVAQRNVEEAFLDQLARGGLVAKGLLVSQEGLDAESAIPAAYWRVFNIDKSDAKIQTVGGNGMRYVGVCVARA